MQQITMAALQYILLVNADINRPRYAEDTSHCTIRTLALLKNCCTCVYYCFLLNTYFLFRCCYFITRQIYWLKIMMATRPFTCVVQMGMKRLVTFLGICITDICRLGLVFSNIYYSMELRWCHRQRSWIGISYGTHDIYVKRVSQRSAESRGFLCPLRFPSIGNVGQVDWDMSLTGPSMVTLLRTCVIRWLPVKPFESLRLDQVQLRL